MTAVIAEMFLNGVTEKFALLGPFLFCIGTELQISTFAT